MKRLGQALRLMNDAQNPTEAGFKYWQQNNKVLLADQKKKLEQMLQKVNELSEKNDNATTFSEVLAVYHQYQHTK